MLQIVVCLFVLGGMVCAALPPDAQEAYDKGVAASDKGQYLDAIANFEAARQKAQTKTVFDAPELYRKLGETEAKVPGRELRAICWLAAYLSVVPTAGDADSIKKQMIALRQTSRDRLWSLMQMTEDAGKKVAAREDARGLKQTSLDTVVCLWAECGGYAEAKEVASTVVDVLTRSRAYNRVTYAQIEAGDFAGAWTTIPDQEKSVEAIDDPYWDYYWRGEERTSLVLDEARLAEGQARTGDLEGARASVVKAKQTASLLVNINQMSQANGAVAVAQALTGDIKGAQATVSLVMGPDTRAEDKLHARIAIAEAQLKAGDLAGARFTLVETQHMTDDTKVFHGPRDFVLAPTIAELDRAGPGLNDVYRALSLAQAHSGDWEGSQRTAKFMDLEARKAMNSEFIRQEGVALMAADQLPVLAWLQEVEDNQLGWRTYSLNEPLFTDYFHCVEGLGAKDGNVDQTFSNFERAIRGMQGKYSEVGQRLKEQFGL